MSDAPKPPKFDIGSDATVAGSLLATAAPPSVLSGSRAGLSLERELPPELDRSSLSPRERDLVISRYRLLSRLGAGGMGLVYLAYDPSLDRKVAIKLLRPGGDDQEPAAEAHARLHREAQALAKLSHPNVVAVYDVGTYDAGALYGQGHRDDTGQGVFLVMEYIEGVTLARWLEERPRSWREVVETFLAAGHGLVAAHAVGVIHRDFKPSNVLVRSDGSVHVFDFGLARSAGAVPSQQRELSSESLHETFSSTLSSPLTQYGAFIGTPAYMAPEQRGGEEVDERSDQFSFCVALYEGLFGNRPFSGENIYALEMAKLGGAIDPPRRPVRLPKGLHRLVLRGLAAAPKERWPSLPALLAELERLLRRRRGRIAAAVLAVAMLGAGLGAYAAARADVCTGAPAAFAEAWGEAPRAEIDRAFAATKLAYAADTADRVAEHLDDYRTRWLAVHTDACLAANVRRTQSPALMDRRMLCLQQRRDELLAVLAVFAAADADVVEHAVAAVRALPAVEACADLEALERAEALPADPALALAVAEARRRLAAAGAQSSAGRFAAARTLAQEVLAVAVRQDDRHLRALAEQSLGVIEVELAEHGPGERDLEAAYFDALALGRDELALESALNLANLTGDRLAHPEVGLRWLRHADALLDRVGRSPETEARLHAARGGIAARSGDYAGAEAAYRAAIAAHEAAPVPDTDALAAAIGNLASLLGTVGQFDEAIALSQRALAMRSASLGPGHPSIANVLTNLGGTYALLGDNAAAEAAQRRALQIWRASLPPRHDRLAFPLAALGDLALQRGAYDEARRYYDEARIVWELHFGADYPSVIIMHERLANVLLIEGSLAPARALAERAVRAWDSRPDPDPGGLTLALLTRAQIATAEHDLATARVLAERARTTAAAAFGATHLYALMAEMLLLQQRVEAGEAAAAQPQLQALVATIEKDHGPDARWLIEPLLVLAAAHNGIGQYDAALADLDRARVLATREQLPSLLASLDLQHARVLWDSKRDRPRAHVLARTAADAHRRAGALAALAEVQQWLREHPLPGP
ncbi:serine/threonine-protein kinase [Nannocystis sp.]|uniref:protein kinase domain-containing protein n=1 Tax=Nannocystis sp. TaxID=1962667 RepID=UPI0025F40EBC|nr:serine/threonine-protein kinase [Nannocystis sp.]MBK7827670.1 serine/threonine protein kinase [Nannocystis sp.]